MSSSARRKKISRGSSSSSRHSRSWSSYASPSASAFWKMVGFDVTPTTASSSIIRFSSPLSSHSRESESIQTLWPCSESSCRRDLDIQTFFLDRFHLLQTPHVALAAVEPRAEEGADELAGELRSDDLGADAENVHVVVLYPLVR